MPVAIRGLSYEGQRTPVEIAAPKPLIATSLDELSRKTFWIHPQRMVLALG